MMMTTFNKTVVAAGKGKREGVREEGGVQVGGFGPTGHLNLGRSEGVDDVRGKDDPKDDHHGQDEGYGPEKAVDELPELIRRAFAHVGGDDWHEGGGERAISH